MSQLSGKQKKFKYIEHPADIAFRVYGKTLPSLFKNAVRAIYDILKPHKSFDGVRLSWEKEISSTSIEGLLVPFLNEILYLALERHLIFSKILIKIKRSAPENKLRYKMIGYKIDGVEREIKAVTYHNLKIKKRGGYYLTDVIVDI
ncbi:MAG: archease [bacterium]|nr:archease [bacterium]